MNLRPFPLLPACVLLLASALACNDSTAPEGDQPAPGLVLGRRLAAGENVACALTTAGKVFCWGINTPYWEYGAPVGSIPGGISPTAAAAPVVASLARGVGPHFCGIGAGKDGVCWGRDGAGQLGRGYIGPNGNAAGKVGGALRWTDLAVGRLTTCGIAETGAGYCWGRNQYGVIGTARIPIDAFVFLPSAIDGGHLFKSISAGWLHTCAVATDGTAYCWGNNLYGQLGINASDTSSRNIPTVVSESLKFTEVSAGSRYTCGLTTTGDAYCWGANATGQLGDGTTITRAAPVLVSGGRKYTQLVTSSGFGDGTAVTVPFSGDLVGTYGHTCALATDGRAYCWGWNGSGQLGDGTQTDRHVPTAVSGTQTFSTLAAGGAFTCGMLIDNVWCWGSNVQGQVGSGDGDRVLLSPRAVGAPFRNP